MKHFSSISLILFFILLPFWLLGQPATTCYLSFRLFDKHGAPATYDLFRKEIKFIDGHGTNAATPWVNKYVKRKEFYDKASGYFHIPIQSPLGDFSEYQLIYRRDTMTIKLKNQPNTISFSFTIDSLTIQEGSYLISSENGRLQNIDLKKARVDYYNNLLLSYKDLLFLKMREPAYFNEHHIVKEIRAFKKGFEIGEDDNEPKTGLPEYHHSALSIKGVIIDEQGNPAVGAYIVIAGRAKGYKEGVNLLTEEFNLNLTNDFRNKEKITIEAVCIGFKKTKLILRKNELPLGFYGKPFVIQLAKAEVSDGWGNRRIRY